MESKVKTLLDEFFRNVDALGIVEQRDVWHILTALRGPDADDYEIKGRTTARLRSAVCGRFAMVCGGTTDEGPVVMYREDMMEVGSHFYDHMEMAVKAARKHGYEV